MKNGLIESGPVDKLTLNMIRMSTYLTKQTPATTSPIRPAMEQPATTAENNSNNYPLLPVTTRYYMYMLPYMRTIYHDTGKSLYF